MDGPSTLTINSNAYVGWYGAGTLGISNGGQVTITGPETFVGPTDQSQGANHGTGYLAFGGAGGTLTTQNLFAAGANISGTGLINTSGLVSDFDLSVTSTSDLRTREHYALRRWRRHDRIVAPVSVAATP